MIVGGFLLVMVWVFDKVLKLGWLGVGWVDIDWEPQIVGLIIV